MMKFSVSNRFSQYLAAILAVGLILGCSKEPEPSGKGVPMPVTNPADVKMGGAASPSPAPESKIPGNLAVKKADSDTKPAVELSVDQLPAEIRSEGFEYYGLAYKGALKFEIKNSSNPTVGYGTRTFTLAKVEGGKAYFTESHEGSLADAGNYDLMVDKTGVYVVGSKSMKIDKPQLEIPADLEIGTTWHTKNELEDTEYKVVKKEKVTTAAGEREAILIVGTGTAKVGTSNTPVDSKFWVAKGLGQVKTEFKTKPKPGEGKPQTVTMEEAKG